MTRIRESQVKRNIGWVLRRERIGKRITQSELSRKANISRPFLNLVENGQKTPSYSTVETIAACLGKDPAVLIADARIGDRYPESRLRYLLARLLKTKDTEQMERLLDFVETLR